MGFMLNIVFITKLQKQQAVLEGFDARIKVKEKQFIYLQQLLQDGFQSSENIIINPKTIRR